MHNTQYMLFKTKLNCEMYKLFGASLTVSVNFIDHVL